MKVPIGFQEDLKKAIEILKNAGCSEIYLFGSFVSGNQLNSQTDLDIAIKGLPKNKFFAVYGKLLTSLKHTVDLVGLDYNSPFSNILKSKGKLERVA